VGARAGGSDGWVELRPEYATGNNEDPHDGLTTYIDGVDPYPRPATSSPSCTPSHRLPVEPVVSVHLQGSTADDPQR
jgi:hypothetical protein